MKAKVKATGEIVEIIDIDFDTLFCNNGGHYTLKQIEGIECDPDYWTRLEHQYAGMAMQGLISYIEQVTPTQGRSYCDEIVCFSTAIAHALVEKMKEERK